MAKRFTDTGKWNDKWFRALSPAHKLAWGYLCDCCDVAGVIDLDRELANFQIGLEVDWDALIATCDGRIESLGDGRYWIVKFIEFQYVALSRASRVHRPIILSLERHGLNQHPSVVIDDESSAASAIRKRITKKYRDFIYATDEFCCQLCGQQFSKHDLTIDHLVAISRGGTNDEENLYTTCRRCNSRKTDFDIAKYLERAGITLPVNRLSKFLDSASKILDRQISLPERLKEKEQDKDQEQDKDKAQDTEKAQLEKGSGGKPSPFDAWWKAVPNKIGKRSAARAYDLAARVIRSRPTEAGPGADDPHAFLLERMTAFAGSPKARTKFCPHPATWLNEGRYDDDPSSWQDGRNDPRNTFSAAEEFLNGK